MASQITSLTIVYSTVYLGADQRKHQSTVSLAFVQGIHRGPVNSPHKWPVTRKMFPFDDVIMLASQSYLPHLSYYNAAGPYHVMLSFVIIRMGILPDGFIVRSWLFLQIGKVTFYWFIDKY